MSVVALTAILLICFNILMWLIFLHRLKSDLSTEKIVDETRNAINDKIREANNAVTINIQLVEDKIHELNKVKAEAERRIHVLKRELETQDRVKEFQQSMSSNGKSQRKNGGARKNTATDGYGYADPAQGEFMFTEKAKNELGIPEKLVEEPASSVHEETLVKIPVVPPVYYKAENQITPKKDFRQQVKELYSSGLPAEEIAHRTSRSVQEVRLVLQML